MHPDGAASIPGGAAERTRAGTKIRAVDSRSPPLLTADVVRRAVLSGVGILLFVILGNPSSGGPAAPELMPAFWRDIGQHIPVGAGVSAFRNIAYFPAAPLSGALLTLFGWLVLGVIVALIAGRRANEMTQGEADVSVVAAMAP